MKKKLGIALGSGGARGVAHIGFLQALQEEKIQADFVSGCSMGSIVGACYCAGVPMEELKREALNIRLSTIATLNVNPIRANGLLRMNKARKMIEAYLGADCTFDQLSVPFCCVATDIVTGKTVKLNKGSVVDAIIASSSIPGAFSPLEMGDMLLVDGGILERVPVKELKPMGAEVIVAVDVLGNLPASKPKPTNLIASMIRFIDIIDTRITHSNRCSRRSNIDLWLEPKLGDMDQYQVKNLSFAYEKGYEMGKENAAKIRNLVKE